MNKQKQTEAMAVLDGIIEKEVDVPIHPDTPPSKIKQHFKNGLVVYKLPDYFTDNEIDRLVRGLSLNELDDYAFELSLMLKVHSLPNPILAVDNALLLQATPEQKVEAYLRAYGKWQDKPAGKGR